MFVAHTFLGASVRLGRVAQHRACFAGRDATGEVVVRDLALVMLRLQALEAVNVFQLSAAEAVAICETRSDFEYETDFE